MILPPSIQSLRARRESVRIREIRVWFLRDLLQGLTQFAHTSALTWGQGVGKVRFRFGKGRG
jgi:hypothetical protein